VSSVDRHSDSVRRGSLVVLTLVVAIGGLAVAASPPARKPLGPREREAILALLKAVDRAQETDVLADDGVGWNDHVLKGGNASAYVPFRLSLGGAEMKQPAMYVRAVSRHDGLRAADEHSMLREWVLKGGDVVPRPQETVYVGLGEMPIGGIAIASRRETTAAAAAASGALMMQQRAYEKQKAADEAAKKKEETRQRDPFLFPFEDYYFLDLKPGAPVERALALPPGEYDVFVAMIDRGRVKTSSAVVTRHTVRVPDFWADQLALSSIILARDVRTLKAPFAAAEQGEHPYAFGFAEVVPAAAPSFTQDEALTVVYQICNYGAPDADLTADYTFYRTDGARRVFNHTNPQVFADEDLPKPGPWETAAFATQAVPLSPFPPGTYELEVSVRDRLTRATAKATVAFTVSSGVR
jgi:hypothetical protein